MKTPNGKNFRFENGEWWYHNYKGVRTRCVIKDCPVCLEAFPISKYSSAKAKYCSRACGDIGRRQYSGCKVDDCDRPHCESGYCEKHWGRIRRNGDLDLRKLPRTPGEPGGRTYSQGYIYVYFPEHPNANRRKTVGEHVLVMTESLGRALHPGETVHHRNGVRDDNRPENLELWTGSHPRDQRVSDQVAWAKELLQLYEPDSLACNQG
jgi:hypothetical protein